MPITERLTKLAEQRPNVCVVGSINADLTVTVKRLPHGGETIQGSPLRILPGGKSANQAATAGRLGAAVELVGAVGSDPNAQLLRDALTDAHVDISAVETVDSATGTAMIVVDDAAENFIVISAGANGEVDAEMVRSHADKIQRAGCLGLCLEICDEAVLAAAQIAHDAGVPVVFNLSPIRAVSEDLLALVDVLIVNEHELAAIIGSERAVAGCEHGQWDAVGRALADEYGISTAIVTLGGEGSAVLRTSESEVAVTRIPALPIEVVDTTGCGDAYMGTVLTALAAGDDVVTAARLAGVVSAHAATGVGAQTSYGETGKIAQFAADHGL